MSLYTPVPDRPSYFDRVGYQAGFLAGICCLMAGLILVGHGSTHERIEQALRDDKLQMLTEVIPPAMHNNDLLDDAIELPALAEATGSGTIYIAKQDDNIVGYAFTAASEGYSGVINMIMGLDSQGNILGVRVVSHNETPGLGDKIELAKDDWILSFNQLSLANTARNQWAVKKDGGQFDQFTGATITPRAVVRGILQGLDFFADIKTLANKTTATETKAQQIAEQTLSAENNLQETVQETIQESKREQ